jgi:hypothetical protein
MCKIHKRGTYEYTKALIYVLAWRVHYEQELKRIDKKQRGMVGDK